jgi:DNA-binding transcriptional regulator YhcF (GntR family)
MRLWLQHEATISLRQQLTTQIVLGILCRELTPGEKLPSTRELARRFRVHANTVSAVYRGLERDGWVEQRRGSGVYVKAAPPAAKSKGEDSPELRVDRMIGQMVAAARAAGAATELIAERMRHWLAMEPPARWLLVEPDAELARIVVRELEQHLALPVESCTPQQCAEASKLGSAMALVLPSKAEAVRPLLPASCELTVLAVQPVTPELHEHLKRAMPEHRRDLIGIASRWQSFLRIAETMLVAAGIAPEGLLVRDALAAGWKRGLTATAAVVCDAATADELPEGCRAIVYWLIDDACIGRLRAAESRLAGNLP